MTTLATTIASAAPGDAPRLCEPVLRCLPDWFGIESATRAYIDATARLPTWIAAVRDQITDPAPPPPARLPDGAIVAGFITIQKHYPLAAEIHCIAVRRELHGRGIGTTLVRHAESLLRAEGVHYLQVKTMGPSRPNREYALTTRFYESIGFARLEEITGLWPGLPTLILVKRL